MTAKSKKCSKCHEIKSWIEFYMNPNVKTGLSSLCIKCFDEVRETNQKKYILHLKQLSNIERDKATYLLRCYNLTVEQYNELFNLQEGKCMICGVHQSSLDKALCVDHDHSTGEVRGLLCGNCNSGIGFFKDNVDLLNKAIIYLKK